MRPIRASRDAAQQLRDTLIVAACLVHNGIGPLREALNNLSRVAFESSQTVRQGVRAPRLPQVINKRQAKLGNAGAASVRPNRLAAGALRVPDLRQGALPCNLLFALGTLRPPFLASHAQSAPARP